MIFIPAFQYHPLPMTISDLSPAQLYGLVMLALVVMAMANYALSAYKALDTRAKVIWCAGMLGLVGVPIYLALTALLPTLPNP